VLTKALISTSPFKHGFEQVLREFEKSVTVQPGIVVRYALSQTVGRFSTRGVKSEREMADEREVRDSSVKSAISLGGIVCNILSGLCV
jgi:hypothetical protein